MVVLNNDNERIQASLTYHHHRKDYIQIPTFYAYVNELQLYIEKEGIMLAFSPSGVRAPQRPQMAGNGRPAVEGEPFWEEALTFTRHNFLQREVEVEVSLA